MPPVIPPAPTKTFASPLVIDPGTPADPSLRALARDVLHRLRVTFAAVAAEDGPTTPGAAAQAVRAYLAGRKAPVRQRYRAQARAMLAAPAAARAVHFGRYAALEPADLAVPDPAHFEHKVGRFVLNPDLLGGALKKKVKITFPPDVVKQVQDNIEGHKYKKMRMFVRKVTCHEETDEWGSDEISLGGFVVDAHGTATKVGPFAVSNDFDEGEGVDYGFSKTFATWDLVTNEGWPVSYCTTLVMGEVDSGGFTNFVHQLWLGVAADVKKFLEEGGQAVAAYFLGEKMGQLGKIVGKIVGDLLDWVLALFDNPDDVSGYANLSMVLGAASKSYYDWAKLTSAEGCGGPVHFHWDGGHYRVDVSFKVFTQ